jgi:hypothetical protein
MMKKHVLLITLMMTSLFYGCEQYVIEPPDEVTFTNIQAIFTKSCTGCHFEGTTLSTGLYLTEGDAYNALQVGALIDTANPASSILYVKLNSGDHSIYASKSQREAILKWIEDGAPNN